VSVPMPGVVPAVSSTCAALRPMTMQCRAAAMGNATVAFVTAVRHSGAKLAVRDFARRVAIAEACAPWTGPANVFRDGEGRHARSEAAQWDAVAVALVTSIP